MGSVEATDGLEIHGLIPEPSAEWRRLLQDLYREETGLVPAAPAAEATSTPAQTSGAG